MKKKVTRREFIQKSVLGIGAGTVMSTNSNPFTLLASQKYLNSGRKLPREVWIASFSQMGLSASDHEEMISKILNQMDNISQYEPDIICLPEIFPFANIQKRPDISEVAEKPLGQITQLFADYAKNHNCYIVCPVYTTENGKHFNSAVIIDREGKLVGEYRKIRPTEGEIRRGVFPGPEDPPVFKTDFGTIGVQICFDIKWFDGWRKLKHAGAEIVFWPSAFAGGIMVNTMAWQNNFYVVSSTRKDTSKICDISGAEIAKTGRWNPNWVCASVNLEKEFLHTWPYVKRFNDIRAKYGRKIKIKTFHEEEWTIIESLSPDLRIVDIMREFELKSNDEHIRSAELAQEKARKL